MSDNRDKPTDPDPDATVSLPPRKPVVDEDATVSISSRDALKAKDDDATVTMPTREALQEPVDDDATVTNLTRDALLGRAPVVDEDATLSIPPGGLRPGVEAAEVAAATAALRATPAAGGVMGSAPASNAGEFSRLPMIAGGIVVFLVLLYFIFGGGQKTPPATDKQTAPSAAVPAPSAAVPAPSTAPATAPGPSPAAPATPAASAPATPPPAATASTKPVAPAASTPAAASAGSSKVKDLLAADIKRGTVAVVEEGGVATITILAAHQFASGGIDPETKLRPILLSIASALDKATGAIVITGHADSTPSSNPKFPSNQELSAARGASAAKVMATKLRDPKRISSDGASDSKPLAPGDTTENRAKNRRVVIVLKPGS